MNEQTLASSQRRITDKSFTILCIDDESVNLKVLASIFKDDYRIVVGKTAKQGLEKALEVKPDLILLDVVLPDESGFELMVKLKAHAEIKHIPVIFITGLQSAIDEEKGLTLGACDYIHKPFNYGIVRARVNTQLELIRQRNLLEKYANFDSLTELPNRRKWRNDSEEVWQLAQKNNSELTFGIVDIDCFKLYNDTYGHQQGDIVLRRVANTINRVLYEHHGRIYRCGGEEFYFYIGNHKPIEDTPYVLDQCIANVMNLNIEHKSSSVINIVSVSIGAVKVKPNENLTIDDVMECADQQLYQIKNSTRNAAGYAELDTQGLVI